jgi:predicted TIM-barrel fold metal-dependent hydrolase
MHAMDMSHPNLLAFVKRIHGIGPKLFLGGIAEPFLGDQEKCLLNLLTVMENSIEDYFCLMEYFLKSKQPVVDGGRFRAAGTDFDTILLTPLVMDFGLKDIKTDTFYDVAIGKPVVEQSADILRAIAKYCSYEVVAKGSERTDVQFVDRVPGAKRLFEIYAFLGLNTRNFEQDRLENLLQRCFGNYTGQRSDLFANMGGFSDIEDNAEDFRDAIHSVQSNMFGGIKVYPPLGFDPWPSEAAELAKVRTLYRFCQEKQIPITAHCSDGGFVTVDNAKELSSPDKWEQVLNEFQLLKLNFAHFGNQEEFFGLIHPHAWRNKIIKLAKYFDHVYTDISCLAFDDDFYEDLAEILEENPGLVDKVMFGSDYMINLQWIGSYNEYLQAFRDTDKLTDEQKMKICSGNPERFLFRE